MHTEEVTIGKMENLEEIRLFRKRNPQIIVPHFISSVLYQWLFDIIQKF